MAGMLNAEWTLLAFLFPSSSPSERSHPTSPRSPAEDRRYQAVSSHTAVVTATAGAKWGSSDPGQTRTRRAGPIPSSKCSRANGDWIRWVRPPLPPPLPPMFPTHNKAAPPRHKGRACRTCDITWWEPPRAIASSSESVLCSVSDAITGELEEGGGRGLYNLRRGA